MINTIIGSSISLAAPLIILGITSYLLYSKLLKDKMQLNYDNMLLSIFLSLAILSIPANIYVYYYDIKIVNPNIGLYDPILSSIWFFASTGMILGFVVICLGIFLCLIMLCMIISEICSTQV